MYTDPQFLLSSQLDEPVIGDESVKLRSMSITYARFVYNSPFFGIITTVSWALLSILLLLFYYDVVPQANTFFYRWSGDEITKRWDAYTGASKETYSSVLGLLGKDMPFPKQMQLTQAGVVIYEKADGNVYTPEILKAIWMLEDEMRAVPGYEDYCFKVPINSVPSYIATLIMKLLALPDVKARLSDLELDTGCIAFKSIITDFKSYFRDNLNYSKEEITHDLVTQEFIDNFTDNNLDLVKNAYLGVDVTKLDNGSYSTSIMRSLFPFAMPIKGYMNKYDRQQEQQDAIGRYQNNLTKPVDRFDKRRPYGVRAYSAFVFGLKFKIASLVLQQVWWLVGSFSFLFVFALIVQRSFFASFFGVFGMFLPIPSGLCALKMVIGVDHVDVIYVIGLFLICGIGADCIFILFDLFRQSAMFYGANNELRLAYTFQRGFIALTTSISTSAISFLALVHSGVRIMNFFGVFCFLLLFFTYFFTFTYYLSILAIWAKRFEKRNYDINLHAQAILDHGERAGDYPDRGTFDFLRCKLPKFNINVAGLDISRYNRLEKFVYQKLTPIIYLYRLPIVIIFLLISCVMGYYASRLETKSELRFLPTTHPLQRAYDLSFGGFTTGLNDWSFVYVWGIEPKTTVKYSERLTIDEYGSPIYYPLDILTEENQLFLTEAWNIIRNETDLIDSFMTSIIGVSPWEDWNSIFSIDKTIDYYIKFILEPFGIDLPEGFPLNESEYYSFSWLWQSILSKYAYTEPEPYVPGTSMANTIGFSMENYSMMYIGMKASMKIPDDRSVAGMRVLYNKAEALADKIRALQTLNSNLTGGFQTSIAWMNMVLEEKLPKQVAEEILIAFIIGAVVVLISTGNIIYAFLVFYSMTCTVLIVMGILYHFGWKIGTNEAIMMAITSGFCADFIIQPMLALSYDSSERSLFGKIQGSLTTFSTPVGSALVTTLVAAAFLYPCQILLFPPFASFLIGSGLFGIIHGFIVLPALIAIVDPYIPRFKKKNEK